MFYARVDPDRPRREMDGQAERWLDAVERARYDRFRHDADRSMFLLGRVMARTLVGDALGVPAGRWRWQEGPRGRPDVANAPVPLSFNLAHSGGVVVCALACEAAVGVDVERRSRPVLDRAIVDRYCAPAEAADVHARGATRWHDRFLEYWTLKEAYLKARGLGIGVPLAQVAFDLGRTPIAISLPGSLADDTAWAFDLRPLGDDHFLATAVSHRSREHPTFIVEPWRAGPLSAG